MSIADLAGVSLQDVVVAASVTAEQAARIAADTAHAALTTGIHGLLGEQCFRVYKTGAVQAFVPGWTKVNWTNIDYDLTGAFSLANDRWDSPFACKLLVLLSVDLDAIAGADWQIVIGADNGVSPGVAPSIYALRDCRPATRMVFPYHAQYRCLGVGVQVSVWLNNLSGGALNLNTGNSNTWLAGYVLSQST
jgi:hypothetical protein